MAGNELLKPVRPSAHHVFLVGRLFAVFVVRGFAGDDQPVADKTQEWRGRLIGGELDGVFVHRLGFDDRRGRPAVVEESGLGREPLHAHQLFAVEAAVGPRETDVALPGDVADAAE